MKSTPLKWVLRTAIIAVLLLITAAIVTTFVLPFYVESKLIPKLSGQFGLKSNQVSVRRIGWWGTDLGPIQFTAGDVPAITLAAIQVDYTPLSLLQGRINGITLGGLGLDVSVTPDGVVMAGGLMPQKATPQNADGPDLDLKSMLPITLGRFSILKSYVVLNVNNRQHHIPFDIQLDTHRLSEGHLKIDAASSVAGNPMALRATIDQSANKAKVTFDINDLILESLGQFWQLPAPSTLSGSVNLSGWCTVELKSQRLSGLSISGEVHTPLLSTPAGALTNKADKDGAPLPIRFTINGDGLEKLQWHCQPFRINSFLNLEVNELGGDLAYAEDNWSLNSMIKTFIPRQAILDKAEWGTDLAMDWKMSAHGKGSESDVQINLESQAGNPISATVEGQKISIQKQAIHIQSVLDNKGLRADGSVTAKALQIQRPEGKMNAPSVNVEGTLRIPKAEGAVSPVLNTRLEIPDFRSNWGTTRIHIPKINVQMSGAQKPREAWRFDARVGLTNGRVTDRSKQLRMTNLTMSLPLQWPAPSAAKTGNVKISAIRWKNLDMGSLKGKLQQTQQGLAVRLRHASKLFPGMNVLVHGDIDASGARIDTEVPPYRLADAIDLGQFTPEAAGFRATGQIEAFGQLEVDGGGAKASGRFKFNQGRLQEETKGLLVENINMDIQMDDLLEIKSAPQQRLRVDRLAMGNLKADQLSVDFQIENPQTLFVESAGINWSKGKINTSSIRVISGKSEYDVTLFCDRLNLAMVLEQLGAAEGGGEGTVSGRIPIRWTNGRLHFDNGFLYSAPGQTGSIQLTGTQMLLSGLPPGSPQHTQLDIATEALKDYIYKWAKLNLLSEGETLLLKLQFDGKPNRLLPFAYDTTAGQFKRVAGEGQADFTGLRIDLNFRSPLNRIINYKDLLKQEN